MKKIILLYAIIGLILLGCGVADTIDPSDDPFRQDVETEGTVTGIRATLGDLPPSKENPCIRINFDTVDEKTRLPLPSPAHGNSIIYGTTVLVYYDGDSVLLNYGTDYEASPYSPNTYDPPISINIINIILKASSNPYQGRSVRVRLTGVYSYADSSIKLAETVLDTVIK